MLHLALNQERLRGGARVTQSALIRVTRTISRALHVKKTFRISVAFVSEHEMKTLNWHHRGKRGLTDVLSFTLENEDFVGEVLISYEQAKRQAKQMKHSVHDEVIFLLVHGVLHVFGFDHEESSDAKKMFSLQTQILLKLGIDPRL